MMNHAAASAAETNRYRFDGINTAKPYPVLIIALAIWKNRRGNKPDQRGICREA
jgi:hypothetical protein